MNKSALSFCLAILVIALVAYSVYLAIKGDQGEATYCLVWAIAVQVIVKGFIS
jgi:hypothetical protein